jgi:hypothetical protein
MNRLLEILKRKICVSKTTDNCSTSYIIDIHSAFLTEDEYNIILEFIKTPEEEEENE